MANHPQLSLMRQRLAAISHRTLPSDPRTSDERVTGKRQPTQAGGRYKLVDRPVPRLSVECSYRSCNLSTIGPRNDVSRSQATLRHFVRASGAGPNCQRFNSTKAIAVCRQSKILKLARIATNGAQIAAERCRYYLAR